MNNWIETSGSPFVIVEQQYAHQWKGQENYNAICSVTDYLGKIYIDNHVLLVMGDEPMATRIVNKDGAILIIRWKYAPDYLTVEKLLENDIVTGAEPIEEVEVKWDSTELVLFDSLSPYCEASFEDLVKNCDKYDDPFDYAIFCDKENFLTGRFYVYLVSWDVYPTDDEVTELLKELDEYGCDELIQLVEMDEFQNIIHEQRYKKADSTIEDYWTALQIRMDEIKAYNKQQTD